MVTHYNYSSLQLYNSLQPVFGVATTPRIGYYKIQSVITIDDSKEVLFLSLWKLRFNEEFQNINQVLVDTEIFEFNATINASVDIMGISAKMASRSAFKLSPHFALK